MISRRNLLGVHKRGLILVDHNEVSQAVDNVLDAEILEIIDHHRLGSLETNGSRIFRNQPVGCTGTIIYQIFREQGVAIPPEIAGLLVQCDYFGYARIPFSYVYRYGRQRRAGAGKNRRDRMRDVCAENVCRRQRLKIKNAGRDPVSGF